MGKKGFTLLELMIVVGIIAILGLVAMPQYSIYQAKSRRVEGMNLLTGYYTAAHAARGEFGFFPGNFVQTDYAPVGILNYRLRVNDNAGRDAPIALNDNNCWRTSQGANPCDCGGACPNFRTWQEGPVGILGARIGHFSVQVACAGIANLHMADNTFSVRVGAVINLNSANYDRIGIDEMKQIAICMDGTK